jgi:hypothetical protein
VPDVRGVQLAPSVDVRTVPAKPAATNFAPAYVTPRRSSLVPDVRVVQVTPSGDVRIVPVCPTATKVPAPKAAPRSALGVPDVRAVHAKPSDDERIVPLSPTATAVEPLAAIPRSISVVPRVRVVQDVKRHPEVVRAFEKIATHRTLWTTSYVLVETVALLQQRIGLAAVRDLEDSVVPLLSIEWISREIHGRAMDRLRREDRRDLSLVDCASYLDGAHHHQFLPPANFAPYYVVNGGHYYYNGAFAPVYYTYRPSFYRARHTFWYLPTYRTYYRTYNTYWRRYARPASVTYITRPPRIVYRYQTPPPVTRWSRTVPRPVYRYNIYRPVAPPRPVFRTTTTRTFVRPTGPVIRRTTVRTWRRR